MIKNTLDFTVSQDTKTHDVVKLLNELKVKHKLVNWDISPVVSSIYGHFFQSKSKEYNCSLTVVSDCVYLLISNPSDDTDSIIYNFNIPQILTDEIVKINNETLLMIERVGPITQDVFNGLIEEVNSIPLKDNGHLQIVSSLPHALENILKEPVKSLMINYNKYLVPTNLSENNTITETTYRNQYKMVIEVKATEGGWDKRACITCFN